MSRIITFTGQMGSGKSTALKYFRKLLLESGRYPKDVKFAQPLYDIQEYIYNRIEDVYERPVTFEKDRKLLQWIGTEWGRDSISKTLWVDLWKAAVNHTLSLHPDIIVLCDDVRFDNEAAAALQLGGVIIKTESTRNLDRIRTNTGYENHPTEAGITKDFVSYVVNTDGQLSESQDALKRIFDTLFYRQTS